MLPASERSVDRAGKRRRLELQDCYLVCSGQMQFLLPGVVLCTGRWHAVAPGDLELAVLGVPMVVVYPVTRAQRLLRPALLISPHFALANVAAGLVVAAGWLLVTAYSRAMGSS